MMRFDWTQLRGFLATAEEGSLSAAAKALNLTQPTLGRQVAALEQALGVVLFERVGRGLVLTPGGHELLPLARAMGQAAEKIALVASGQAQTIEGRICITAADVYSAFYLPPVLSRLRDIAPRLAVEVLATNDISDLLRREADIAIRHVRPTEPDLIARLVREHKAYFYASRGYLDRHGRPETKAALKQHDFISPGDNARYLDYIRPLGIDIDDSNLRIGSANGLVAWEMAQQGLGIIAMSKEVAARAPAMERLLPEMAPITFPLWLVTHRELHNSARIRLVYDLLAEELA